MQNGKTEWKDFVLGWCAHIPSLTDMNENVKEEEVRFSWLIINIGIIRYSYGSWIKHFRWYSLGLDSCQTTEEIVNIKLVIKWLDLWKWVY